MCKRLQTPRWHDSFERRFLLLGDVTVHSAFPPQCSECRFPERADGPRVECKFSHRLDRKENIVCSRIFSFRDNAPQPADGYFWRMELARSEQHEVLVFMLQLIERFASNKSSSAFREKWNNSRCSRHSQ